VIYGNSLQNLDGVFVAIQEFSCETRAEIRHDRAFIYVFELVNLSLSLSAI
jgi:hypothetical protein